MRIDRDAGRSRAELARGRRDGPPRQARQHPRPALRRWSRARLGGKQRPRRRQPQGAARRGRRRRRRDAQGIRTKGSLLRRDPGRQGRGDPEPPRAGALLPGESLSQDIRPRRRSRRRERRPVPDRGPGTRGRARGSPGRRVRRGDRRGRAAREARARRDRSRARPRLDRLHRALRPKEANAVLLARRQAPRQRRGGGATHREAADGRRRRRRHRRGGGSVRGASEEAEAGRGRSGKCRSGGEGGQGG